MNHKQVLIFTVLFNVILLQLAAPVFASCIGYTETFDVRVLDAKFRAVEGANVSVKYDRGASFGEQYFTTQVKQTNANGIVHMDIFNQGTTSRVIDCNIKINASVGGSSRTVTVVAEQHGSIVDVVMDDVYRLRFYVRNQANAPLTNATVSIAGESDRTDQYGQIKRYMKVGSYTYLVSYLDASQSDVLNIVNDTDYVVQFSHYKISIDVTDDKGTPLNSTIFILNKTVEMPDGHFENEKTFGEDIPYEINYMGIVTTGTISTTENPIITVRYDLSAPLFESITPSVQNDRYRLNMVVSDPNIYASGVDISSVKVSYKVEPSDPTMAWNPATVFTASGRNKFSADFPELPANSIVKFKAEVKDMAGNRAEQEGTFTTMPEEPNPTNTTENNTNTQPPAQQEQGIPLIYIVGGGILLILAIYLVFRIKTRPDGGN